LLRVCEVALVGFADRCFEAVAVELAGQVYERENDCGHRDASVLRHVRFGQCAAVDGDAWTGACDVRRHGYVDPGDRRPDSAKGRGARVAEHRTRPAGQHRGHPQPLSRQLWPPDRVDASVHREQPPSCNAALYRLRPEPELEQLPASNDSVLLPDQVPNHPRNR
jgi:hypothetical protein